jgi:hypothetical protein
LFFLHQRSPVSSASRSSVLVDSMALGANDIGLRSFSFGTPAFTSFAESSIGSKFSSSFRNSASTSTVDSMASLSLEGSQSHRTDADSFSQHQSWMDIDIVLPQSPGLSNFLQNENGLVWEGTCFLTKLGIHFSPDRCCHAISFTQQVISLVK